MNSIENKRLFLDFTQDTKELKATEEPAQTVEEIKGKTNDLEKIEEDSPQTESDNEDHNQNFDPYADEAAAWANYYNDYDDYADEDEDRDIEDALGLGSY